MVTRRKFGSDNVALARPTQRRFLDVYLPNCGREVHHAAFVVTVLEADGVADFVDDFLAHAVGEDVARRAVRESAVGGGLQAVSRDDAAASREVREAEDVVAPPVVQVLPSDGDVLAAGADPLGQVDELLCPVLVPGLVVRTGGDGTRLVHGNFAVVDGSEAVRRLALDRRRDVSHRHDVNVHRNAYAWVRHKYPAVITAREAIVGRLKGYDRLVEVGVGKRTDVGESLAESGCEVTATDVVERTVSEGVGFVIDDVTDPESSVYADADCVYGLNLPPELHRPAWDVARNSDAAFLFTTLGGDPPQIPVDRETLPDGETLFRASGRGPDSSRD